MVHILYYILFSAVFGGLEAHGLDHGVQWTRLSETANAGVNQIKLQEAVTWAVGDEIVIAPTSYSIWHTETFTITAVSADMMTLTLNSSLAFNHIVYSETLATGQSYTMAAEVGHLTRNIKIRGAQYPAMEDESFGARLVVGRTAEKTKSYVGFARISNVEFVNTGQEGFTDSYDPRFSVSFMDVVMKTGMPSYVKMSAFHNGFSPAIGVFGTNDLLVEKNVIHRTVESGLISNSARTNIRGNLLLLNQWSGSYQDRFEPKNIRYHGSIELIDAITPILKDNVVAGSERIGYHILGESCSGSGVEAWSGNQAHTSLIGVGILPTDPTLGASCVQFSNFMVWKNGDFGIYYNSERSIEVRGVVAADNQVGIFTFVVGPSAVGHVFGDKTAAVEDTLVIGHTPSFDCSVDRLDPTDANVQLSGQGRSFGNGTGGVVGMSTTTFNQGSNNAPEKPFINIMAYNSINGLMTIDNVTYARFAQYCGTDYDYCITTNPSNDDAHHPVETSNLRFTQVGEDNKIYFHIPSVGKINSADCVDMDCDGLKKNLITDIDGSLLGTNGTVIAWSEYQWDGDRRRGLGDYRIPKVLLSDGNGDLRDVSAFAPHKGLIRNEQCIFHDYWRAYECHDIQHKILIIENMDEDTELRRISPVAVLSEGYLDLINGPQDHGWCSGYTCRKRLSTFQAMTAIDKYHDVYFTGTTPQHLRFYLLDTESSQGIRVGVWYATPNRLDVHVNGQYVVPNNGEMKDGRLVLKPSSTSVEFMPAVAQPSGSNYVKRDENMMFFIIKGSDRIDITLASVVVVSFSLPEMTIDEFFGENLIQNMAAFLGVDPRKVRIVDVVREDSGRRRKRQTGAIKLIIEIGDEPDDPSPLPFETLEKASEAINIEAQAGSFDTIVNATVLGVSTIEPTPPLTDPNWANVTKEVVEKEVVKVDSMEFLEPVVPGIEQQILATPPRIEVFDVNRNHITELGTAKTPWVLTASLRPNSGSNPSATLNGMKTLTFVDGWANFTDLSISHPGTGYIVDFKVTSPAGASNMVLSTPELTVPARDVSFDMVSITNSEEDRQNLTVVLELLDMDQDSVLSDISWRGQTWHADITVLGGRGTLSGTTNMTFDPATSRANFEDLRVSSTGSYELAFNVYSEPEEYAFTLETNIRVSKNNPLTVTGGNNGKLSNLLARIRGLLQALKKSDLNPASKVRLIANLERLKLEVKIEKARMKARQKIAQLRTKMVNMRKEQGKLRAQQAKEKAQVKSAQLKEMAKFRTETQQLRATQMKEKLAMEAEIRKLKAQQRTKENKLNAQQRAEMNALLAQLRKNQKSQQNNPKSQKGQKAQKVQKGPKGKKGQKNKKSAKSRRGKRSPKPITQAQLKVKHTKEMAKLRNEFNKMMSKVTKEKTKMLSKQKKAMLQRDFEMLKLQAQQQAAWKKLIDKQSSQMAKFTAKMEDISKQITEVNKELNAKIRKMRS